MSKGLVHNSMEVITNIRTQLSEFFSKLERKQIIQLSILAALILAVIITVVILLNHKEYAVLYSDLTDSQEKGELYTRLRDEGVDVKTSGDTLLLPVDVVEQWRMLLASEGYPRTARNYDVYEMGSGFGSTDQTQLTYKDYQTERNLEYSIKAMDQVTEVYVLLNIQRSPGYVMSRTTQPSTATVTLVLADPSKPLTDSEAMTIRYLVVTAVENLDIENISIVDTQARSYAYVDPAEEALKVNADNYLLEEQLQDRFNKSVKALLSPVFGEVLVQSAVRLNYDRRVTQSVVFSPPVEGMETGLPISIKRMSESISAAAGVQGEPGLDENGGGISYVENYDYGDGVYQKASEEANMEVNEVKTLVEAAQGSIEYLTISVVIPLMESLPEDHVEAVRELVAMGVGTALQNVSVHSMPLLTPDIDALSKDAQERAEAFMQNETIRLIIIMAGVVIVFILLLIALRSVLKALKPPEPEPVVVETEGEGTPGLIDLVTPDGEEEEEIDMSPTTLMQIQEFIEKDPASVAQLLRNWLSDEFR